MILRIKKKKSSHCQLRVNDLPIEMCFIDTPTNIFVPYKHQDLHFSFLPRYMRRHGSPKRTTPKNNNLIQTIHHKIKTQSSKTKLHKSQ